MRSANSLWLYEFLSASVAECVEMRHGDGLAAEHEGHAFRGRSRAAKHGGVVGTLRSSHRGCIEDASDELE
eukprot:2077464-Pleurochrysis_carterae.AAC.1